MSIFNAVAHQCWIEVSSYSTGSVKFITLFVCHTVLHGALCQTQTWRNKKVKLCECANRSTSRKTPTSQSDSLTSTIPQSPWGTYRDKDKLSPPCVLHAFSLFLPHFPPPTPHYTDPVFHPPSHAAQLTQYRALTSYYN